MTIVPLFFLGCGQSNNDSDEHSKIEGWETFSDADYSIQYPADWTLNNQGSMGTSFFIFAPLDKESNQFRENINLLIQDLSGLNLDLDSYVKISEEQIEKLVSNLKMFESSRKKANGSEFHKFVYDGSQGVLKLHIKQYVWLKDEKAYILTYTTEQTQKDKHEDLSEKIMSSFSFN